MPGNPTPPNNWAIDESMIDKLPWSDRARMWAGLLAKSLPETLAREIQLATFNSCVTVYTVLSIMASGATVTITVALVPLDEPLARLWVVVHVAEYLLIWTNAFRARRKLTRRTLTIRDVYLMWTPPVVLAGLLWGSLPLVAGPEPLSRLYLTAAVAGMFSAVGFFWPFGIWPLSTLFAGLTLGGTVLTIVEFDPDGSPMFSVLAVLLLATLITLSGLAAHALARYTSDSVIARERQQSIDLLLHDHDRRGLDFLWETDDDLRFGPIPGRMTLAARGDPRVQQGQPILNLIDDPEVIGRIKERQAFDTNVTTSGPDGEGELRLSARPKPMRAARVGFRGIGTDAATARAAVEAERMQERLDTMVALTGGLAHDFNNQMATVVGAVELACLDDGIADSTRNLLQRAAEACMRTRRVTSELVAASGHSTTYEAAPFELVDAVQQIVDDVASLYPKVTIEVRSESTVWVHSDKSQYMRAVRNLVENGCHAVLDAPPELGQPRQVTVTIEHTPSATNPVSVTEVADTGPGFKPEHEDAIFNPFFTTRRAAGGTGLGLSTARGFAHQANGSLSAHNSERGARFRLQVPSIPAPLSEPAEPDEDLGDEYIPRIEGLVLVVEDEDGVALNVIGLLENLGATVETAADVASAIGGFTERVAELECVISDLALPDGEGFEVIAALRQRDPSLKAIYMSGYTQTLPSTVAPELRCPFLQKPFSTVELVESLRAAGVGVPEFVDVTGDVDD